MTPWKFLVILISLLMLCCSGEREELQPVRTGLDRVQEYEHLFRGKRVGIITNHTALNARGEHITDVFSRMKDVQITALFGPEHGIRGSAEAGAKVESELDPLKGIPIYSLYGKTRKPTPEMLQNVDVLVFDIQDIGVRYYTYIYTMGLAMEAAAEQHLPFVVLDRPNPLNGEQIEGNILDTAFASFVGMYPLPVRHGLTVGELARMINGQGWLSGGLNAKLEVVPMENWRRSMWFDETGLQFIKTSPNMPDLETATVYPGICLLEGTNVSTGRGTPTPFKIFGAPWIEGVRLAEALNALKLPGVQFKPVEFTPVSIPGAAEHPRYQDERCSGVRIQVTHRNRFHAFRTGVFVVKTIRELYPQQFQWLPSHFDRLAGTDRLREAIEKGENIEELLESWEADLETFYRMRKPYLLYE